jgi:hypothetical protein
MLINIENIIKDSNSSFNITSYTTIKGLERELNIYHHNLKKNKLYIFHCVRDGNYDCL